MSCPAFSQPRARAQADVPRSTHLDDLSVCRVAAGCHQPQIWRLKVGARSGYCSHVGCGLRCHQHHPHTLQNLCVALSCWCRGCGAEVSIACAVSVCRVWEQAPSRDTNSTLTLAASCGICCSSSGCTAACEFATAAVLRRVAAAAPTTAECLQRPAVRDEALCCGCGASWRKLAAIWMEVESICLHTIKNQIHREQSLTTKQTQQNNQTITNISFLF